MLNERQHACWCLSIICELIWGLNKSHWMFVCTLSDLDYIYNMSYRSYLMEAFSHTVPLVPLVPLVLLVPLLWNLRSILCKCVTLVPFENRVKWKIIILTLGVKASGSRTLRLVTWEKCCVATFCTQLKELSEVMLILRQGFQFQKLLIKHKGQTWTSRSGLTR